MPPSNSNCGVQGRTGFVFGSGVRRGARSCKRAADAGTRRCAVEAHEAQGSGSRSKELGLCI